MDDYPDIPQFRPIIPDFSPVIPAKAGIQRVVGVGVVRLSLLTSLSSLFSTVSTAQRWLSGGSHCSLLSLLSENRKRDFPQQTAKLAPRPFIYVSFIYPKDALRTNDRERRTPNP